MSTPGVKVGVSEEEKKLSYYKYFEQDLAPVPAEKIAVLQGGPIAPEKCIPFDERNKFLKGEDDEYANIGFGVAADGTALVCNTTYMPGVTGEMLDWWFPWHSVGSDLRYKIWDPEDHYFARAYPASYVVNPNVPMNQKTWGVDHYIMEDVGPGPEFLKLCFKRPADFGYDESIIAVSYTHLNDRDRLCKSFRPLLYTFCTDTGGFHQYDTHQRKSDRTIQVLCRRLKSK